MYWFEPHRLTTMLTIVLGCRSDSLWFVSHIDLESIPSIIESNMKLGKTNSCGTCILLLDDRTKISTDVPLEPILDFIFKLFWKFFLSRSTTIEDEEKQICVYVCTILLFSPRYNLRELKWFETNVIAP